jgi:membrane protease YdiL (CAAX protease family)
MRSVVLFYLLAFAISTLIWSPLIVFQQWTERLGFLLLLGAFGPFLAAAVTASVCEGREGLYRWVTAAFKWRIHPLWYLAGGLLLPILMALLHVALHLLLGGSATLSVDPPWYWAVAVLPLNVIISFAVGSGKEELGWQGFAVPRLVTEYHPLVATAVHGTLWAAWHLPLYLTSAWSGEEPLPLMFAYAIPLSMIMFWITRKSGGSALPAWLLHTSTNIYSSLYLSDSLFVDGLVPHFTVIKTIVYWLVAAVLIVATGGRLGHSPD